MPTVDAGDISTISVNRETEFPSGSGIFVSYFIDYAVTYDASCVVTNFYRYNDNTTVTYDVSININPGENYPFDSNLSYLQNRSVQGEYYEAINTGDYDFCSATFLDLGDGDGNEFSVTLDYFPPATKTLNPSDISETSITANANIRNPAGYTIIRRGFIYNTSPTPGLENEAPILANLDGSTLVNETVGTNFEGDYNISITGLSSDTKYYIRAFVESSEGYEYDPREIVFETHLYKVPDLATYNATEVENNSVRFNGSVLKSGSLEITERGFVYRKNNTFSVPGNVSPPAFLDLANETGSFGVGAFYINESSLDPDTEYFFSAYARNSEGYAYGDVFVFRTTENPPGTVNTDQVTNIGEYEATLNATIVDPGLATTTRRGFVYSNSMFSDPGNNDPDSLAGVSVENVGTTSIEYDADYSLCGFYYNDFGGSTIYGYKEYFCPPSSKCGSPQIDDNAGFHVDFDDNCEIIEFYDYFPQAWNSLGWWPQEWFSSSIIAPRPMPYEQTWIFQDSGVDFDFKNISNPCPSGGILNTITDKCVDGTTSSVTNFDLGLTGLVPGDRYYLRSFIESGGVYYYGQQRHFDTSEFFLPTVSTNAATAIGSDEAMLRGAVDDNGKLFIDSRGFIYSTSTIPPPGNTSPTSVAGVTMVNSAPGGLGDFDSLITGLASTTTYYARSFAENAKGFSYGDEISFVTTLEEISNLAAKLDYCRSTTTVTQWFSVSFDSDCKIIDWEYNNGDCISYEKSGENILPGEIELVIDTDVDTGRPYSFPVYLNNDSPIKYDDCNTGYTLGDTIQGVYMPYMTCYKTPPDPPPMMNFYANPDEITVGETTELFWDVEDGATCDIISGGSLVVSISTTTGSQVVSPLVSSTYDLGCTSSKGVSATLSVNVVVNQICVRSTCSVTRYREGSAPQSCSAPSNGNCSFSNRIYYFNEACEITRITTPSSAIIFDTGYSNVFNSPMSSGEVGTIWPQGYFVIDSTEWYENQTPLVPHSDCVLPSYSGDEPALIINSPSENPFVTTLAVIDFSGVAYSVDGIDYISCTNNGVACVMAPSNGKNNWKLNNISLGIGDNNIEITAFSLDGGSTVVSTLVHRTNDVTLPVITISSPTVSGRYTTDLDSLVISGTVDDDSGILRSLEWSRDGGLNYLPILSTTFLPTIWSFTFNNIIDGSNNIIIKAVDQAYNETYENLEIIKLPPYGSLVGYIWNPNIGWISTSYRNCNPDGVVGTYDGLPGCNFSTVGPWYYEVEVDMDTGHLSGYGWSENVGWVSFQYNNPPYSTINTPDNNDFNVNCYDTNCTQAGGCMACYHPDVAASPGTGGFFGWARILSLDEEYNEFGALVSKEHGWIRLDNYNQASDYGVEYDLVATNELSGYAWNGVQTYDDAGLGWMSFNCANSIDPNNCSNSNYKVVAQLNKSPEATIILDGPNETRLPCHTDGYDGACSTNCELEPEFTWSYYDPEDFPQQAYRVIVRNDALGPLDSPPLRDTGKIVSTDKKVDISKIAPLADYITYGTEYTIYLMVWDNFDKEADFWKSHTFRTRSNQYPNAFFNRFVPEASDGEDVLFWDVSIYYKGATSTRNNISSTTPGVCMNEPCSYEWIANTATWIEYPNENETRITFPRGDTQGVELTVTDSHGYFCSTSTDVDINIKLPNWVEVK